jgi:CHAT domain-containing protein/tetratricopeptide (TPR) repeat protein
MRGGKPPADVGSGVVGLNGSSPRVRHMLAALVAGAAWPVVPVAAAQPAAQEAGAQDSREAEFVAAADALNARIEAGDTAGAAALAGRLATLGEQLLGASEPEYLAMLERVATYLAQNERRAEALPLFEKLHAGRVAANGADHPDSVTALIVLSNMYGMGGDYVRAEPLMVEALERAERVLGPNSADTLLALNNLGVLRLEQGRHAEAEPLLQRTLAIAERLGGAEGEDTLSTLNALASLYRAEGKLEEAEPLLVRVLDVRERTLGEKDPQTIYSMNALGAVRFSRGDAAGAELLARRAVAAAAALGDDHPVTMDALDGLAAALVLQGKAKEAVPHAERAFAARERVQGRNHPATLRGISVLANAYMFSGVPAKAEPLLARAMEESRQRLGGDHPYFLLAAENLIFARLRSNIDDPRAVGPARELIAGARLRRYGAGADLGGKAEVRRARLGGQGANWYTLFADAALAAGRGGKAENHSQLLGEVFLALQEAVSGEANASIARMAVRRYVEQQGGGLGALVREREQLAERWGKLGDEITQSLAGGGDTGQERARMQAEREAAAARIRAIDGRIEKEFPQYHLLVRPSPIQGPDAEKMLQADEAVVIAVPGPFGTHVLVMTREGGHWVRSDWDEQRVEMAVKRLRYDAGAQVDAAPELIREWDADRPAGGRPSFDRTTAYGLYTAVFQPAEILLKDKKRVYVIGGEALAALPFGLLVTAPPQGADDDPAALRATPWLAERYALVNVPSIQALGLLRGAAGAAAGDGFVGFGDPAFEGQATSRGALRGARLPDAEEVVTTTRNAAGGLLANVAALRALEQLPGTARELAAMRDIFGAADSRVFTRASATETQVYQADLSKARVLVFATHGLTPSDPIGGASASELFELAEPGLVLTPPVRASEQDDGFLSASEVATLKLDADWVILSACNTATGDAATAGLSQLARAFFYAGARNVLASHWPVDDEVASRITVRTLALEQAGTKRAEAFQQAMREIRTEAAKPEWAHPFYWAPFVLIGSGGG